MERRRGRPGTDAPCQRRRAVALIADELAGAVRTLVREPFVRADRIFAVANSEGTLHALRYQLDSPGIPLAGLVPIAPPGRSVGSVARSQIAAQAAAGYNGPDATLDAEATASIVRRLADRV